MNLTIPSAVYAHVTEAIEPPINVAESTAREFIFVDSNPSIAPTKDSRCHKRNPNEHDKAPKAPFVDHFTFFIGHVLNR